MAESRLTSKKENIGTCMTGAIYLALKSASKTSIAPGQKAVFHFKPTIWIGAISQVAQGEVMNSAIINDVETEISLLGIASADIVMTGGGSGAASTAFEFNLENVVMA